MDKFQSSLPTRHLLYLVRCAVHQQTPDKQACLEMDHTAVLQAALRHSLTVAAAASLEQVMPLPEMFNEEKYKALRRLVMYQTERLPLLHAFAQKNIWYMPLKGIVLKDCYPIAEMREMSDNDILFDAAKAADVRAIMEHAGYICKSFGKIHHDVYQKGALLEFEMHRHLFDPHTYPQLFSYYKDVKQRLLPCSRESCCFRFSNEDFYIFLICHLYKHYQSDGTGLRSLLDVYMFNKKHGDALDRSYITGELNRLQLAPFEKDVRLLSEKVFTGQPLSESENRELAFYMDANTHGTLGNRMAKLLENDDSKRAKYRYVLQRIFPSRENIQKNHPFVSRHKALYPLLVVYRPIKGVLHERKRLKSEIKNLKHFKKKDNRGKFNPP